MRPCTTRVPVTIKLPAVLLIAGCAPAVLAQGAVGEPDRGAQPNPLKNVYFGEQHMHTVNSPDAFVFGTRNTPDPRLVERREFYPGLQERLP